MNDMIDLLEQLCLLKAPSGDEGEVRRFILEQIGDCADCKVDALGNIIAQKQGREVAACHVMVDAHMDEVGFIITGVTSDGFLRFDTLGGMDPKAVLGRRVLIGNTVGVIGCVPVHLLGASQRTLQPEMSQMVIDIGAKDRAEALSVVAPGDTAVFDSEFVRFGDGRLKGRAIDDRVGCAILIELLRRESEFGFTATFTVQEENGLIGAKAASFSVEPQAAIVLEATTAADVAGVPQEDQVCRVGQGPVLSFMDRHTIYDRSFNELAQSVAREHGIPWQLKQKVAGGNNAGAIHASRGGVRTAALSLPCRYLHSATCVIGESDLHHTLALADRLVQAVASGRLL